MGIAGLWSLVEAAKEDIALSECKGKRIAVDLSAWILRCGQVSSQPRSPPKQFLAFRGVFFEAVQLSKLGINLVFVIDGVHSPVQKGKTNRYAFYQECLQYKNLLTAMGFAVVEARGEAEKMCAELNQNGLVDGVLTEDGDALVYGANVVYKGMSNNKKVMQASRYTMSKVKSTLGMSHRDLVAFALLSKGDVTKGVHSVGEKKFLELFKELRQNKVEDCLDRLKQWRSNTDLDDLEKRSKQLPRRPSHCKTCLHEGTKSVHSQSGCQFCRMEVGCRAVLQSFEGRLEHPVCCCTHCDTLSAVRLHVHELKVRQLAVEQDSSFPRSEFITEFLEPQNVYPSARQVCMKPPDFKATHLILKEKLNYDATQSARYLVPWTIKLALNGILPGVTIDPLKIVKSCTDKAVKCYEVKWARFEFDELSDETESAYELKVAISLFTSLYPDMSSKFESASSGRGSSKKPKSKRKLEFDPQQRKMSDMFKVVKKASTSGELAPNKSEQVDCASREAT